MESIDIDRLVYDVRYLFRMDGWRRVCLADGSIRVTVWSRATSDKPLVELFPPKGYMADSSKFDLKVNLPENEKLLAVILLYRPAKNRYVCVVSDDRMTSETSYSNLTELSTALLNLKKRYSPDA